ncbi:hypothetical protein J6590_068381 [Homalodisca vitripennis]|nr:hypothetical protein J6590_068381 [Homalodisca vitripennis]
MNAYAREIYVEFRQLELDDLRNHSGTPLDCLAMIPQLISTALHCRKGESDVTTAASTDITALVAPSLQWQTVSKITEPFSELIT